MRNTDEFRRNSTTVGSLNYRETDMPLMPTAAAPSDPPDVLPEMGRQKSKKYGLATARFQSKQKETENENGDQGVEAPTLITHHAAAPTVVGKPEGADVRWLGRRKEPHAANEEGGWSTVRNIVEDASFCKCVTAKTSRVCGSMDSGGVLVSSTVGLWYVESALVSKNHACAKSQAPVPGVGEERCADHMAFSLRRVKGGAT